MKKFLLIPILCIAMFLPGTKVLAGGVNPPTECPYLNCNATLNWGSDQSEVHLTNHTYCNNQICTVTCVTTPVYKICPVGHGVVWKGVCYEEFHTCSSKENVREYR